jgi:hypothetical protein
VSSLGDAAAIGEVPRGASGAFTGITRTLAARNERLSKEETDRYARGQHSPIPAPAPTTYIQDRVQQVEDQATGFAKASAETVHTVGQFLHNHIGIPMPEEILRPELEGGEVQNGKVVKTGLETKNTNEAVGKFGEAIGEFVLGDEAVKGMSIAERLGLTQKVMKLANAEPATAPPVGPTIAAFHFIFIFLDHTPYHFRWFRAFAKH